MKAKIKALRGWLALRLFVWALKLDRENVEALAFGLTMRTMMHNNIVAIEHLGGGRCAVHKEAHDEPTTVH